MVKVKLVRRPSWRRVSGAGDTGGQDVRLTHATAQNPVRMVSAAITMVHRKAAQTEPTVLYAQLPLATTKASRKTDTQSHER